MQKVVFFSMKLTNTLIKIKSLWVSKIHLHLFSLEYLLFWFFDIWKSSNCLFNEKSIFRMKVLQERTEIQNRNLRCPSPVWNCSLIQLEKVVKKKVSFISVSSSIERPISSDREMRQWMRSRRVFQQTRWWNWKTPWRIVLKLFWDKIWLDRCRAKRKDSWMDIFRMISAKNPNTFR